MEIKSIGFDITCKKKAERIMKIKAITSDGNYYFKYNVSDYGKGYSVTEKDHKFFEDVKKIIKKKLKNMYKMLK